MNIKKGNTVELHRNRKKSSRINEEKLSEEIVIKRIIEVKITEEVSLRS